MNYWNPRADERYRPDHVDDRHLMFCYGCPVCTAYLEREERDFNRQFTRQARR
ncbi:hypothetical protein [Rhodococcus ruber]|uniref:hypothetical protein n=1 Tax=Rhodococcus ruber TaxID=1830 RepID=UPI00378341E2